MHSGEHLAIAATAAAVELEMIRTRMRGTVAMLDGAIAHRRRRHLAVVDGEASPRPADARPEPRGR